jgi:hypothetical protein
MESIMKAIRIKCRIVDRVFNAIFIVAVFLVLGTYSCTVQAQSFKKNDRYFGLEGTFGIKSFNIKSDIPELNKMQVIAEGGSAGIVIGNEVIKINARILGFYYSTLNVPRTIDLFESEVLLNYYPVKNSLSGITMYLTSGVSVDKIKFYGHYLKKDEQVNYSDIREPYLGGILQVNASVGIGLEYRLPNVDFVHLFAEGRYGIPLQVASSGKAFENTTVNNFTSFSLGVSFGSKR